MFTVTERVQRVCVYVCVRDGDLSLRLESEFQTERLNLVVKVIPDEFLL